jgi:hypothetical protein
MVREAHDALDLLGTVMAHGANIAPDYVMRTVIAMRERVTRHGVHVHPRRGPQCTWCGRDWPCADIRADLHVLGVEGDEW